MQVLAWENNGLRILDQTALPHEKRYLFCSCYKEAAEAIRKLQVRGAPAIGIAAAFGYVLAAFNFSADQELTLEQYLDRAAQEIRETRPTAVNLGWALARMAQEFQKLKGLAIDRIREGLLKAAQNLLAGELEQDARIAAAGADLIPDQAKILTYCNTGALATAGWGTALGVILKAHRDGKSIHVYVPETRPVLQGARLTAWELHEAGVPFTLITDNMTGFLFGRQKVDLVIVGADRIVANGDLANKIGTYGLAVLAAYHRCPFYAAAPVSTFDPSLAAGEEIPVEMRHPDEVRKIGEKAIALPDCHVLNPSFDVTPHTLITAFITDQGIIRPPFRLPRGRFS